MATSGGTKHDDDHVSGGPRPPNVPDRSDPVRAERPSSRDESGQGSRTIRDIGRQGQNG
jgi:hypothetical protein